MNRRLHTCFVGCAAALALCATPGESQAFWNWGKCCGQPAPVVAAPIVTPAVVAVPSCNPCQQTVAYVPQVSYRANYVNVPVTTYQPVQSCNPCGAPVTSFVPVTQYRTQVQMVPYTSYRLVYSGAPAMAAMPVATTSMYAPMGVAPAPSSCCGGAPVAATTYYAPRPAVAMPAYNVTPAMPAAPAMPMAPAPGMAAPGPGYGGPPMAQPGVGQPIYGQPGAPMPPYNGNGGPMANGNGATPQPSLQSPPAGSQQTYRNDGSNGNGQSPSPAAPNNGSSQPTTPSGDDSQPPMTPIPDDGPNQTDGNTSGPRFIPPASQSTRDHVASRWAYNPQGSAVRNTSARGTVGTSTSGRPMVDDGLWKPAR